MSINTLQSFSVRSGLSLLAGAALLTVALSIYFYQRIVDEQVTQADRQLQQLVVTMEKSAAVAAYLDNQELATEVVKGLASNDIVEAAALQSDTGMRVVAGDLSGFDESSLRYFRLESPFMAGEFIGRLSLQPNRLLIEQNARSVARVYVATLVFHSLLLTILAILIMRWRLARPMAELAQRVHAIEPGSLHRLPLPEGHGKDELGQLVSDINSLLDATQFTLEGERRLRQYVESVERRFRLIFDHASCGIVLLDQRGKILLGNPSFNRTLGLEQGTTNTHISNNTSIIHYFDDASQVRKLLQHAVTEKVPIACDLQLTGTRADTARWVHALFSSVQGDDDMLVECIIYDVSERTRREQQARQEAERDPLTGLYNRRAGERLLQTALEQARRVQELCALVVIDLDHFKPINDTYGHDAGDRVLVAVAERLTQTLRKHDVIARWGGDEFVALLYPCRDVEAVHLVAAKLLQRMDQPIDLGNGRQDRVGASIGVAMFPQHGQSLGDLVARADQAMYQAKEQGRNQYVLYQQTQRVGSLRKA